MSILSSATNILEPTKIPIGVLGEDCKPDKRNDYKDEHEKQAKNDDHRDDREKQAKNDDHRD